MTLPLATFAVSAATSLAKGVVGIFVSKVGRFRNELQMTHP